MLVSGVCGSCGPNQRMGFCWASNGVLTHSERSCNNLELKIMHLYGSLPLPFPPSWLTLVSIEVGEYLHWVSQCDGTRWWLPLSGLLWIPARPAQGLHFTWYHYLQLLYSIRHLPQAHQLAMGLTMIYYYLLLNFRFSHSFK